MRRHAGTERAVFERWRDQTRQVLEKLGGEVIASAGHNGGLSVLLALPGGRDRKTLQEAIDKAGSSVGELVEIGSHAERFHVKS